MNSGMSIGVGISIGEMAQRETINKQIRDGQGRVSGGQEMLNYKYLLIGSLLMIFIGILPPVDHCFIAVGNGLWWMALASLVEDKK